LKVAIVKGPEEAWIQDAAQSGVLRPALERFKSPKALSTERIAGDTAPRTNIPLAEYRPRDAFKLPQADRELTAQEADEMQAAYARIRTVHERTSGPPLNIDDVNEIVRDINPTKSTTNCLECAMAVRENLLGRPAIAGPSATWDPEVHGDLDTVINPLSIESGIIHEVPTIAHIQEKALVKPGSHGLLNWFIVPEKSTHMMNIANFDGKVWCPDGQDGLIKSPTGGIFQLEALGMFKWSYYPSI
jgi:hypothetical protein